MISFHSVSLITTKKTPANQAYLFASVWCEGMCVCVCVQVPVECLFSAASCLCVSVCVPHKLRIRSVTGTTIAPPPPQTRKALAKKCIFQLTQLCLMNSLCGLPHSHVIGRRREETPQP